MAGVEIHKNAVAVPLFDLLIALMEDSELREFKLVGGTALALLFGHRRSVAELEPDPDIFDCRSWEQVKSVISQAVARLPV